MESFWAKIKYSKKERKFQNKKAAPTVPDLTCVAGLPPRDDLVDKRNCLDSPTLLLTHI